MNRRFSKELSSLSDEELAKLLLLAVKKHRIDVQIILDRLGSMVGDAEFRDLIDSIRAG